MYADPILLGRYPAPPLAARPWFRFLSRTSDDDLRVISQPLDFCGVNYYYPVRVAAGQGPPETPTGSARAMARVPFHFAAFAEYSTTGFGLPVAPDYPGILLRD